MKKTDTAIKITGLLFFLALLAYVTVYIVQSLSAPYKTVKAVKHNIRESAAATGIVVRDEELLYSVYNTVYISAQEGKRVTKDKEVAVAFNSTEDLQKAVRISELDAEINQLKTLVTNDSSTEDMLKLNSRIKEGILELRKTVNDRELIRTGELSLELRTLAFTSTDSREAIQSELFALIDEREAMGSIEQLRSVVITAPASGLFSSAVDGWETLGFEDLDALDAPTLRELMSRDMGEPAYALGKLIYGIKWYYAALVAQEDCVSLRVGEQESVLFGHYYSGLLSMTVESISESDDGKCAVVFSCDNSLADVLEMRQQNAEIVFIEESGIRAPRKSLHVDPDGTTFVYVQTGLQAERVNVEILRDYGDYYVVRGDRLTVGDDIIVSAENLKDGKVVG